MAESSATSAAATDTDTRGGCMCGAIRYRARAAPLGSVVCHCTSCRRSAGNPGVAWLTFAADAVELERGEPARYRSTPPVWRTFCRECGTSLGYTHADRPAEIDITTGSLDDPGAFPPTHHIWLEDAPGWTRDAHGLPVYPRGKPAH